MTKSTRTPSVEITPGVLRAGIQILDTEGPDGFTVRALAVRAGVAPMAIYNHFDGLNGVLEALFTQGFSTLHEAVDIRTDNPLADFMSAGLAYRSFALENPGLYTIMFLHRFRNFEPSPAALYAAAMAHQALVAHVERCQESGLFPGVSPNDAAQVIWSACHGYVSLELIGINFSVKRDETYAVMLETLRDGFG
ncbi:MAG TPA: TetR/AcrR family transcriptional regulator [Acidimicrobiales bacterium]|jgi:AcrR family transcriptional regulator|nr:TetR/AcrR family transcriptional regulator [Acidimicrobiales bacterium]